MVDPWDYGMQDDYSDGPTYVDLPKTADKKFQLAFMDYVGPWCRSSAEYVRKKVPSIERWRQLLHNEIGIQEWGSLGAKQNIDNSNASQRTELLDSDKYLSDFVLPIAPYVNSYKFDIFLSIFQGPEWLVVTSEHDLDNPNTDPACLPTAYKIQQLLLNKLQQGKIESSIMAAVNDFVAYGPSVVKVFWHTHAVQKWRWNLDTLSQEHYEDVIYECPIIQRVPLNLWLPDVYATHSDIQRWSGIGHRIIKPYLEVEQTFRSGFYNLNEADFKKRFKESTGDSADYDGTELDHDTDADYISSETQGKVKIWEWHGRVPSSLGLVECCGNIVTSLQSESPEDGVLVRLTMQPVLASGLRPFAYAQYNEEASPWSRGMIGENEELQYIVSQFIGQIQDVARRQGNAAYMAPEGSASHRWLEKHGGIRPGDVIPYDTNGELQPVPSPNSDVAVINQAASQLLNLLERNTGSSETFQGVRTPEITATQASILQKQSQAPASTRTRMFASNIIEPACNIALALLQQYTLSDQTIVIKDYDGNDRPITITAEEIQNGKYRARCSLTNQDSTSIARAQSIERILAQVPGIKQVVNMEGRDISVAELFQRYLDSLQIFGTDRIIKVLPPAPAMPPGVPPAPGGPFPPTGMEQQPQPTQLAMDGGPMGPEPTDANAMAQQLQLQALSNQGGMP